MPEKGLSSFIVSYIAERRQPKREALEKEEAKAMAGAISPEQQAAVKSDFARQYQELDKKYEVRNWLSDAARRAGQISLVTHALKFTHSDARGSSIYNQTEGKEAPEYLSTLSLKNPILDAVGNAASLDLVKLLQTDYQGDSLVASLMRDDTSALAGLAENEQQLAEWVSGLRQVLTSPNPTSHKLAKQIYFPIAEGQYHLISPLFSSSLTQALHERIIAARFSEQAKEVNTACKAGKWHSQPRIAYLQTAIHNFGGTKPQNISYLNSVRGGKAWLLSCAAPVWQSVGKPPLKHKSIFNFRSEFSAMAQASVQNLKRFLLSVRRAEGTKEIRQQRQSYIDEIIDILFNYVAGIYQQSELAGWSNDEACELKRSQRLWLDPLRGKHDEVFCQLRETGDWQKEVARDFGYWLSQQIKVPELKMAETEQKYFSATPLFKQRLREMERDIKEELL